MNYNFKAIHTILPAKDMVNVVLSKTMRKTPTVVHPGYDIGRIRAFYMRKVKFTQETINEKLTAIIQEFPKLDDIHPFYGDLINVLYDKDHYKLALGHISACRNVIDNVGKDYNRLLKYGDSLYRCKMLKRAALGRMCTCLKKLTQTLNYLEEVRKHLSRLPTINPFEKTILITGFPNVGKSSFINNISNANVDVQPYPFTTQSLYVGHTDYQYMRFQVIDTPGILDHSLEERNTIEMQAVTALAHLKACILFFFDPSETCGYTINQQINLFKSIKPLFKNKPHMVVFTKTDLKKVDDLDEQDKKLVHEFVKDEGVSIHQMSNVAGDGIAEVKLQACDLLIQYKSNEVKTKTDNTEIPGLYIAKPSMERADRQPHIPQVIKQGTKPSLNRPNLKELQNQYGGAGVFNFPLQEHFILDKIDWKYDVVPEIMDGKNIADFVDADILQRLQDLEKEEEELEQVRQMNEGIEEEIDQQTLSTYKQIREKRSKLRTEHKLKLKQSIKISKPTLNEAEEQLKTRGLESDAYVNRMKERTRSKSANKNKPKSSKNMEVEDDERSRSRSRSRSLSLGRTKGFKKTLSKIEQDMESGRQKVQRKMKNEARAQEGDRRIFTEKPKHLFSGKSGIGKADRR